MLEELQALGIAFVSLGEGIDATTPAGKLQNAHPGRDRGVRAQPDRGRLVSQVVIVRRDEQRRQIAKWSTVIICLARFANRLASANVPITGLRSDSGLGIQKPRLGYFVSSRDPGGSRNTGTVGRSSSASGCSSSPKCLHSSSS